MAMMRRRGLLTGFIHCEHRSTMRAIGNLSRLDVNLYFLTGPLVLIVIHSITDIRRKFALSVFTGFCTRPSKGPGVPKSCARVARSSAHVCESRDGGVGLAGRGAGGPLRVRQRIVCADPFHYYKLVCGKYFERL